MKLMGSSLVVILSLAQVNFAQSPSPGSGKLVQGNVAGSLHDEVLALGKIIFTSNIGGSVFVVRSDDMGETFSTPMSIGIGIGKPRIVAGGGTTCVCWSNSIGEVWVAVSPNSFSSAPVVSKVAASAALSGLEAVLVGSGLHLAWLQGSQVAYRLVDISQPISVSHQIVSATTTPSAANLHLAADSVNVYLTWSRGGTFYCDVAATSGAWPAPIVLGAGLSQAGGGGGGANADASAVAALGGTAWFVWHESVSTISSRIVGARWAAGSLSAPVTVMTSGPVAPPAYSHQGLRMCASGARFYVLGFRDVNSVAASLQDDVRCVVATTSLAAGLATWSEAQVDTDPLALHHAFSAPAIVSDPLFDGHVSIVWNRGEASGAAFRFAKSLDSGQTWVAQCAGCGVPVLLANSFTGRPNLLTDGNSVLTSHTMAFGGAGPQDGLYCDLIVGHLRYDVCSASTPSVCGAFGASIDGVGVPWTSPVVTPQHGMAISIVVTSQGWSGTTFPVALMTTIGRAPTNFYPLILGAVAHIDIAAPIVNVVLPASSGAFSLTIPDSVLSSFFGSRIFCQGLFLDASSASAPTFVQWSNGLEVRVN